MSDQARRIDPKNLTAQLRYRAAGNPPGTLPDSAISNCYPGLEFDFRNVWKRIFVGIELHEADNYVVRAEDPQYAGLVGHRLLRVIYETVVDGSPREVRDALITRVQGPQRPNGPSVSLTTGQNPYGVAAFEWSNALASMLRDKAGEKVRCELTAEPSTQPRPLPEVDGGKTIVVELEVRRFFEPGQAVVNREMVEPGELTQSLCSPWQNDYRECACYYWAASRPDYVNVAPNEEGTSEGNNWMQKDRTPETPRHYILDDRVDTRMVTYDDLFQKWEEMLRFEIGGKDRE
jgi:hypothetical protein